VLVLCCPQNGRSSSRSRGTDPKPVVPAWVHSTDGVGPALLSPDGAPVRWLLMDGYVYDIRDDQDHPPWQEGPLGVNEWRPQTWRETLASPMDEI
jgi:hypothetical protein